MSQRVNYYMTGYTTKCEDAKTKSAWESAQKSFASTRSQLYSLGRQLKGKRESGGPEACIRIDGQHMFGTDATTVYLQTSSWETRHRRLKDIKTLRQEPVEASPFYDNMVDTYYIKRSRLLEDVCLYEIVKNYKFEAGANGKLRQIGGPKGCMVKRAHEVVVKCATHTLKDATKEEYYHQLLMLFLPYRNEEELIAGYETYEASFSRQGRRHEDENGKLSKRKSCQECDRRKQRKTGC